MKKQIILIVAIVMLGMQAFAEQVKVNVHVKNNTGKAVSIVAVSQEFKFELDAENKGSVVIDITKPSWARFSFMGSGTWIFLYLAPGNDINIEMDVAGEMMGVPNRIAYPVTITCDDGGLNSFLVAYQKKISNSHLAPFNDEDVNLSGEEKVARFDEIVKHYEKEISTASFSEKYKPVANSFIKYSVANSYLFFIYAKMRVNEPYYQDEAYYQKMESLIVEAPEMIGLRLYHDFMQAAVVFKYDKGELEPAEYYTKAAREMVQFEDQSLSAQPIAQYVYQCINRFGVEGTEELQKMFLEQNPGPRAKQWLEGFVAEYKALAKGAPSPTFNYEDLTGNMVSLESLKGKYVYIDMWATWCKPCMQEVPHLIQLEHDYADKNIYFVGISNDSPEAKEKWKAMVEKKGMGGIQLFANGGQEFGMAYKVQGIPHFILIDKEGNIVKSNAPRPSDPEIRKLFDSLEGI